MIDILRLIAAGGVVVGAIFCFLAALGLVRLPDFYTRIHSGAKAGVVGSGMILLALGLLSLDGPIMLRALAAILFLVLTTPISSHLLARAAYSGGLEPAEITRINEMKH